MYPSGGTVYSESEKEKKKNLLNKRRLRQYLGPDEMELQRNPKIVVLMYNNIGKVSLLP